MTMLEKSRGAIAYLPDIYVCRLHEQLFVSISMESGPCPRMLQPPICEILAT